MKIERVICAPLNYSHRQQGQLDGLAAVFGPDNIAEFDFWGLRKAHVGSNAISERLLNLAREFKPDWIWFQIQESQGIKPEVITQLKAEHPKCVITHWTGDCRPKVSDHLAEICKATDVTLISSIGQIPMFQAAGAKIVEYVQIGADYGSDILGDYDAWRPSFRVPDVVLCGNYYGKTFEQGSQERLDAIRALVEAKIDVGVIGRGWPDDIKPVGQCHVKQQHHVYKRAKVALSINHFNNVERYYSDRQIIAMASGTPVVARYVPGLGHEFVDQSECVFWDPLKHSLVESVQWLLANPGMAGAIGRNGREAIIKRHTWASRFRELLPRLELL